MSIETRTWPPNARQWLSDYRAKAIQSFVLPDAVVFEYSANAPFNLAALKGGKKIATVPEGTMPDLLSSGIQVIRDLSEIRSVDLAICYHVFEYLPDPVEPITKLKEILKPGGTLLVFALYDKAFRNPKLAEPAEHFYSWNVQTLANLLIDCGYDFQSGKVARCPNEELTVCWAQKLKLGETGFRIATAACRVCRPEFEVRVAVKRPPD